MHMPDGILPLGQAIVYLVVSSIVILFAIYKSKKRLTIKQIPIIGVLAAGIFAAQMFNFPVPFGSSGHLIGTALATTLVGPWVAIVILSSILIVEAMFGDGGFLAFGANALNMAIVGALTTFVIYYIVPRKWTENKKNIAIVSGIAGFISTTVMAFFASSELAIAGAGSPALIFTWMMGLHAIIGVAEGLITFTIVFFLFRAEPLLLTDARNALYLSEEILETDKAPVFKIPVWTYVSTIAVFIFMSIFGIIASSNPDGLERTFEVLGISSKVIETGIFGLPEGLGWDILEMAISMIFLFFTLIGISYLVYRMRLMRFNRIHPTVTGTTTVEQNNENKEV